MRPASHDRGRGAARRGFVLPLALFMLMAMALLTALLLDAAVQELRGARGEVAGARAQAAAESALSDVLASRPDSALLERSRGVIAAVTAASGAETTRVVLQPLGNGLLRVTASGRAWSGGVRGDAAELALIRIVPDGSGPTGSLRYRRLPVWWWSQLP